MKRKRLLFGVVDGRLIVVRQKGGCEDDDDVQSSLVMNLVLFICSRCASNRLMKVKRWPTEFIENTPGVSESFSGIAVVLTADCPGKACGGVCPAGRFQIDDFQRRFSVIVEAAAETVGLAVFVPLYRDGKGDSEEVDDVDEAYPGCFVPVFSNDELSLMVQIESSLCGFVKDGRKFVPYVFLGAG